MIKRRNLYLASSVFAFVVLVLILWNYNNSLKVERSFESLRTHAFKEVHAIQDMRFGVVRIVSSTSEFLLLRSLKDKGEIEKEEKGEEGEKT